jgi:hypothetical protein
LTVDSILQFDASGVEMTRYSAAHFALIGKDIQAWVNLFAEDSAWLDRPNLSFLPKI